MDTYPHLFKKSFYYFITKPYLATGNKLSLVELVMVKLVRSSREQGAIHKIKEILKVVISILI